MRKWQKAALSGALSFSVTFAAVLVLYTVRQHCLPLPEWADDGLIMWGLAALLGLALTLWSEKRMGGHTLPRRLVFFVTVTVLLVAVAACIFLLERPELPDNSPWESVIMDWAISSYAWYSIAVYLSLCHLAEWLIGLLLRHRRDTDKEAPPFRFPRWAVWLALVPFVIWYCCWMHDA